MRYGRVLLDGPATYHVMSRVIEHRFIFGEYEKSYMSDLMRRLEEFTGCEVRTYTFLDNHFHILLHIPERVKLDDDEVKRRAKILYGKKYWIFEELWKQWEEQGQVDRIAEQLDKFRARMYDLPDFMKTFKQRVAIYYNAHHERVGEGPLWSDRYKSTLVEESEYAQVVVGAYIDLNPVRAGVVKDPKDYRWSGYAEAVARGGASALGLSKLFLSSDLDKQQVLSEYRRNLYIQGVESHHELTGEVIRSGFKREEVNKVLDEDGKLTLPQLLHCRVRYFTDGVVIGGKEFVERMFCEHSDKFSRLRPKRGAKQLKSGEWGDLCVACELRSNLVAAPD